jgi:hypothetical protein
MTATLGINDNRASTICQERQDLFNEIRNLEPDLQLNGYPQGFLDSVINSEIGSHRLGLVARFVA